MGEHAFLPTWFAVTWLYCSLHLLLPCSVLFKVKYLEVLICQYARNGATVRICLNYVDWAFNQNQVFAKIMEDADLKVDFNGLIKFSYFYSEATLECFLCTEQIKNGGNQV